MTIGTVVQQLLGIRHVEDAKELSLLLLIDSLHEAEDSLDTLLSNISDLMNMSTFF